MTEPVVITPMSATDAASVLAIYADGIAAGDATFETTVPDWPTFDAARLSKRFADAEVDPSRPIVASCGSGISACVAALALARMGKWDTAVYDGSWAEWGGRADAPVVAGG